MPGAKLSGGKRYQAKPNGMGEGHFEVFYNPTVKKDYTVGRKKTPIGVPSPKKAKFDWDHIFDGHSDWGKRAQQSGKKDIFVGLNEIQIKDIVRGAYSNIIKHERLVAQTGKFRMIGEYGGWKVEFIVNTKTKLIETAYPTGKKKI